MAITNNTITNDTRDDLDQLIAEVRKPEHQQVRGWSMMRLLHPFQDRLTRMLLRTSIASWQLTVVWFLLSLVAYGVSAIGLPITFLAGAVILYAAIVIDLCDGEIGRARARQMSAEADLRSFFKGMFLDRMCHTICTPIWPLAVGWGLYQMHAASELIPSELALAAGVVLTAYHSACRGLPHLEAYLMVFFRQRVERLEQDMQLTEPPAKSGTNQSLLSRAASKIELWVRNGKRFNFMIFVASVADVVIAYTYGLAYYYVLFVGFLTYGLAAIVLLVALLVSRVRGQSLVDRVLGGIKENNARGN